MTNSIQKPKKSLFLYSELAGYFLACVQELAALGQEVHVLHFNVNPEAPFQFDFPKNIHFYSVEDFKGKNLQKLIDSIQPDRIYCGGWIYKPYLKVCKRFSKRIPIVLAIDNPWKGSLRQHLASVFLRPILKKIFTHAWVPGDRQVTFASKLGFKREFIMKGVYSGDVSHYHKMGLAAGIVKSKTFPKRFVFVGRYNQVKGLEDLISAFDSAKNELKDWEFWFTGAGDLDSLISNKTGMRNLGFIQPKDMEPILKETSIFVLPSRYEPWGLALHEFAAAGFPVIVSNEVGAKEAFLVEGENGFSFPASDVMALKKVLIKMAMLSSSQWLEMGKKSTMLALKNTPKDWCEKFLSAKI